MIWESDITKTIPKPMLWEPDLIKTVARALERGLNGRWHIGVAAQHVRGVDGPLALVIYRHKQGVKGSLYDLVDYLNSRDMPVIKYDGYLLTCEYRSRIFKLLVAEELLHYKGDDTFADDYMPNRLLPHDFAEIAGTWDNALGVIDDLYHECQSVGWNLALTGGCLLKEGSRKDIDILAYQSGYNIFTCTRPTFEQRLGRMGAFIVERKHWVTKLNYRGVHVDILYPQEVFNSDVIGY